MGLQLNLIGIIVQDMAKSLAFYRLLGLAIAPELDNEGHAEITLPNGMRLAWDTHEVIQRFDPHWQAKHALAHRMGLAFLCETPSAVDETFERLTAAGVEAYRAPFNAFWGQRYAQVKDPDGNVIDLFAELNEI